MKRSINMTEKTLTYDELGITLNDVYEQMGYHDTTPDAATQAETQAMIDKVRSWLKPRFCYIVTSQLPVFGLGDIILKQLKNSEAYT